MNVDFASSVRSSAFNLTLSEAMIESVLCIHRDSKIQGYGFLYNRNTSNALYKRGLILPTSKDIPQEWRDSANGICCYELTQAGNLVVGLLNEAGFKVRELAPVEECPEHDLEIRDKETIGEEVL